MGDDPETSVVDAFGFAHEAPNLGVLGASIFPTAGGHNPTLTVQALALAYRGAAGRGLGGDRRRPPCSEREVAHDRQHPPVVVGARRAGRARS